MANKTPNTRNLKPIDSRERAQELARLSALKRRGGEPLKPVTVKIFARQHAEIVKRGENLSGLVRRLLDAHLKG